MPVSSKVLERRIQRLETQAELPEAPLIRRRDPEAEGQVR
jgi:hypothetical protein